MASIGFTLTAASLAGAAMDYLRAESYAISRGNAYHCAHHSRPSGVRAAKRAAAKRANRRAK